MTNQSIKQTNKAKQAELRRRRNEEKNKKRGKKQRKKEIDILQAMFIMNPN